MNTKKAIFGLILIFLGIVLLGNSLNLFYFGFRDFFRFLLPLFFIFLGFWLIVRKKKQMDRIQAEIHISESMDQKSGAYSTTYTETSSTDRSQQTHESTQARTDRPTSEQPNYSNSRMTKYSKFLGDMFIDCTNISLENIEVSMGIGDIEINLSNGQLVQGLNRLIISGFVGDIRVFIPKNISVFVHGSNFIGDIDIAGKHASGFGNNLDYQTAEYNTSTSKLYIAANNFIGDIKVYTI